MSLEKEYYNKKFSHVYVEKDVKDHIRTKAILEKLSDATVVEIDNYKDIFCRRNQNVKAQREANSIIIARRTGELVYKGAPVCHSFGNEHFYYTSGVMNCIYDCEYCYLKGMYPSSNIVYFVNTEDIFEKVKELLKVHPVYLCVSYDTDICAMEGLFGQVKLWCDFVEIINTSQDAKYHLTIEIRTKSANSLLMKTIKPSENIIFAFTLSSEYVAETFEKLAPSLDLRLKCIDTAINEGHRVRLCFDPMIYVRDYKIHYGNLVKKVTESIDMSKISDISVGTFRISKEYMKNMRVALDDSIITHFPYENINGYYQYPKNIQDEMTDYMVLELSKVYDRERIYVSYE